MAGGLKEDAGTTLKITRRADRAPLPLKKVIKDPTGQFQSWRDQCPVGSQCQQPL